MLENKPGNWRQITTTTRWVLIQIENRIKLKMDGSDNQHYRSDTLNKEDQIGLKMRGLPWRVKYEEIQDFF